RIDITLTADNGRYELIIADNGRGYEPAGIRQGMGLSGLRERCQALNGTLNLVTAPDAGVRIEVVFRGDK
ncbi:MAG: ATP-binding protein, partial [Burkholderiales bacterium]